MFSRNILSFIQTVKMLLAQERRSLTNHYFNVIISIKTTSTTVHYNHKYFYQVIALEFYILCIRYSIKLMNSLCTYKIKQF